MGIPGSSLVFATGVEEVTVGVTRTIDRWKLTQVCYNPENSQVLVNYKKGYIDPDTMDETFLTVLSTIVIANYDEDVTLFIDGTSYLVPSGTYYDDWTSGVSAEVLAEAIEDATFEALADMGIASGTEVPD